MRLAGLSTRIEHMAPFQTYKYDAAWLIAHTIRKGDKRPETRIEEIRFLAATNRSSSLGGTVDNGDRNIITHAEDLQRADMMIAEIHAGEGSPPTGDFTSKHLNRQQR